MKTAKFAAAAALVLGAASVATPPANATTSLGAYKSVKAHWAKARAGHPDYRMDGGVRSMIEAMTPGTETRPAVRPAVRPVARTPQVPAPTTQSRPAASSN